MQCECVITCAQTPHSVGAGLEAEVAGQGGDGGHEADDERVVRDHHVQVVDDEAAHQLEGEGGAECGQPPEGQLEGGDGVVSVHLQRHQLQHTLALDLTHLHRRLLPSPQLF